MFSENLTVVVSVCIRNAPLTSGRLKCELEKLRPVVFRSRFTVTSTGSNNLLAGYQCGDNLTTGGGNIILGYNLNASAVDVDNELNIGNVLSGDMATGVFKLSDSAGTDFGRLQFGGTTASYPAIGRAGGGLQVITASGSGFASIAASSYQISVRSLIGNLDATDGNISLTDAAGTDFGLLQFGGVTSAFPAIKRSSANLLFRNAADSGYISLFAGSFVAANTSQVVWDGRSRMQSPSDGNIMLSDTATTDFGLLQFGGTTSSFPAWKRVTTGLAARLADDSADADLSAKDVQVTGDLNHDGSGVGFYGTAPAAQSAAYTPSNVSADRAYDADTVAIAELADVVGTLIADLQATGLIA